MVFSIPVTFHLSGSFTFFSRSFHGSFGDEGNGLRASDGVPWLTPKVDVYGYSLNRQNGSMKLGVKFNGGIDLRGISSFGRKFIAVKRYRQLKEATKLLFGMDPSFVRSCLEPDDAVLVEVWFVDPLGNGQYDQKATTFERDIFSGNDKRTSDLLTCGIADELIDPGDTFLRKTPGVEPSSALMESLSVFKTLKVSRKVFDL
jgi:hypothetical protein